MKKRVIEADIIKTGLEVVLKLKIAPEIEDYFKKAAQNKTSGNYTETSSKWLDENGNGLSFYIKDEKLSGKVPSFSVIDNFGNGLLEGGRVNLALLRTVGASEGISIKTNDLISIEELKEYVNMVADWTRDFYETELRDFAITSKVSIETAND